MESKDQSIEQLREQIHKLESGHLSNIAGQVASLQLNELVSCTIILCFQSLTDFIL